jgi:hypothetical protein
MELPLRVDQLANATHYVVGRRRASRHFDDAIARANDSDDGLGEVAVRALAAFARLSFRAGARPSPSSSR